jgi:hypothetical protein
MNSGPRAGLAWKPSRPKARRHLSGSKVRLRASDPPRQVAYRLYRNYVARKSARPPGCIVIVESAAAGIEHARRWIDGMLDRGDDEEGDPDSGMISANFHISLDGSRLLNYAEWADEDAHRAFLGSTSREELPAGVMRYSLFRGLDLSVQSGEAMLGS